MRKKLLLLILALVAVWAAASLSVPTVEAACPKWCCPDVPGGYCIICCNPPCWCPPGD